MKWWWCLLCARPTRLLVNVHSTSPVLNHRTYLNVYSTRPVLNHRAYLNVHSTSPVLNHRAYLNVYSTSPVLNHRAYLNADSISPLQQQSTDIYYTPLGHNILIPSQLIFALRNILLRALQRFYSIPMLLSSVWLDIAVHPWSTTVMLNTGIVTSQMWFSHFMENVYHSLKKGQTFDNPQYEWLKICLLKRVWRYLRGTQKP